MPTITLILETTPDHFGLWLEDATRYAERFFSTVFEIHPDFARGGLYNGRWRWTVEADYYSQASSTFYGPVRLYSFDVIPIAPSRIKVKAESGELGRDAFDTLIARMSEELPIVQPAAAITPPQEAEGEASDASRTKPGPWSPEPQEKLDIWLGWRKAQRKGTRQPVYCDSLKPQIDTSTLRRYKRELVDLGLLDKKGNPVRNSP